MPGVRKWLVAFSLATSAVIVFSYSVLAAPGGHKAQAPPSRSPGAASTTAPAGCDVPGAACDPSKTDRDNGVGNNCDPGYGQGNQAKFPPDEASTSCRTTSSSPSAAAEREEAPGQAKKSALATAVVNVTVTVKTNEHARTVIRVNGRVVHESITVAGVTFIKTGNNLTIMLPSGMTVAVNGVTITIASAGQVVVNGAPVAGNIAVGGLTMKVSGGAVTVTSTSATVSGGAAGNAGGVGGGSAGAGVFGMSAGAGAGASAGEGALGATTALSGVSALAATGTPILSGLAGLILLTLGSVLFWRRRRTTEVE